jgi:predicted GIY-YIG superfamily endonuclease
MIYGIVNMSYVYLLECTDGSTYVGATIDLKKRLRQHNQEIKGGAKLTSNKVKNGYRWSRSMYVSGFPDWKAALQFEWRWKQLSRTRRINNVKPLENRIHALVHLLCLERSTSVAIPYVEWSIKPSIHTEPDYEYCIDLLHCLVEENKIKPSFDII